MSRTVMLPDGADEWLSNGEQGLSSKSIFSYLTGLNILGSWGVWGWATPSDPADLRRCMLLLDAVPDFRERFILMATASDKWAIAVRHWAELDALFKSECPNWDSKESWRAPKTFERMKEVGL